MQQRFADERVQGVGNGKEVSESLASGHHDNDGILKEA